MTDTTTATTKKKVSLERTECGEGLDSGAKTEGGNQKQEGLLRQSLRLSNGFFNMNRKESKVNVTSEKELKKRSGNSLRNSTFSECVQGADFERFEKRKRSLFSENTNPSTKLSNVKKDRSESKNQSLKRSRLFVSKCDKSDVLDMESKIFTVRNFLDLERGPFGGKSKVLGFGTENPRLKIKQTEFQISVKISKIDHFAQSELMQKEQKVDATKLSKLQRIESFEAKDNHFVTNFHQNKTWLPSEPSLMDPSPVGSFSDNFYDKVECARTISQICHPGSAQTDKQNITELTPKVGYFTRQFQSFCQEVDSSDGQFVSPFQIPKSAEKGDSLNAEIDAFFNRRWSDNLPSDCKLMSYLSEVDDSFELLKRGSQQLTPVTVTSSEGIECPQSRLTTSSFATDDPFMFMDSDKDIAVVELKITESGRFVSI